MDKPIDPLESILNLSAKERMAKLTELKQRLLSRSDAEDEEISLINHMIMQAKIDLERLGNSREKLTSQAKVIDRKEIRKSPQISQIDRSAEIEDYPGAEDDVPKEPLSVEELAVANEVEEESDDYQVDRTDDEEADEEDKEDAPLQEMVVQDKTLPEDTSHEEEHDDEDIPYFVEPSEDDLTGLVRAKQDNHSISDISDYLVDEPEYISIMQQDSYPDVSDEIEMASEFLLEDYVLNDSSRYDLSDPAYRISLDDEREEYLLKSLAKESLYKT